MLWQRHQRSWALLCLVHLQCRHATASLLPPPLLWPGRARCMWVRGNVPADALPLSHQGKVTSVALPSSVALKEGAFVASSMATKSVHAVIHSDAFAVVALVIGRGSVVLALRSLAVALRSHVLLVSGAAPRPSSLVLRWPGVGLRLWATRRCVCRCRQGPNMGVARIPVSTHLWYLLWSHNLPCCARSSFRRLSCSALSFATL